MTGLYGLILSAFLPVAVYQIQHHHPHFDHYGTCKSFVHQFGSFLHCVLMHQDQNSAVRPLGVARRCAIILLSNAMLTLLSEVLHCPDLRTATIDVDDAMHSCLRLNSDEPGRVEAICQSFPLELEGKCAVQLNELRAKELDLAGRLRKPCSAVSQWIELRNAWKQ